MIICVLHPSSLLVSLLLHFSLYCFLVSNSFYYLLQLLLLLYIAYISPVHLDVSSVRLVLSHLLRYFSLILRLLVSGRRFAYTLLLLSFYSNLNHLLSDSFAWHTLHILYTMVLMIQSLPFLRFLTYALLLQVLLLLLLSYCRLVHTYLLFYH